MELATTRRPGLEWLKPSTEKGLIGMKIELHAGGRVQFLGPQQRWNAGPRDESKGVLETALYAGQQMMAITDDAGGFELHYLGFATVGFRTMDVAKRAAPEFARRVLDRMREMVAD